MKNNLFITNTRIGDAVISAGVLRYWQEKEPDAQWTIIAGEPSAPLFENIKNLKKLHAIRKQSFSRHWLKIWRKTFMTKWHRVIDMRSSAVSYLLCAQHRHILPKRPRLRPMHKHLAHFLEIDALPSPKFLDVMPEKFQQWTISLGPCANWRAKEWSPHRWVQLIQDLAQVYSQKKPRFLLLGGPSDSPVLEAIIKELPGIDCQMITDQPLPQVYQILCQSQFFVGLDSGLSHLAAAAEIPVFSLFGPTDDRLYKPYGQDVTVIRTPQSYKDLKIKAVFGSHAVSMMDDLAPQTVFTTIVKKIQP